MQLRPRRERECRLDSRDRVPPSCAGKPASSRSTASVSHEMPAQDPPTTEPYAGSVVYQREERVYILHMATILTIDQQRTAGSAAKKVGGYAELIRLEGERRAAKGKGHVQREAGTGRFVFSNLSKPTRAR